MATRQAINVGFPTPNFIAETNHRQTVLPGVFESDTSSTSVTATSSLYTDADTFFSPTVIPGSVEIDPSLYTNSNTFYSPTVTRDIAPSLYSNSNTFFSPNVVYTILPSVYNDADIFYSPLTRVTINPFPYSDINVFHNPIVTPYALTGRSELSVTEQSTFAPSIGTLSGVTDLQISTASAPLANVLASRRLTDLDPLWIALEVDLVQQINQQPFTIRIGNRGSLQRTVAGVLYQYHPRLQTDIIIGTAISIATDTAGTGTATPFYQQPLRGQPNGGNISWSVDPSDAWYGIPAAVIIGRTFRLYVGRTNQDVYADVDRDLTLVYTGHVANYTFDVTANPPLVTVQTTDASSNLDKNLIDDLYPANFPIVSLQGKPKPQLWGRKLSIQPVLEDQISLTYRVTRIEAGVVALDDVTNLTVGGVPWRRITSLFSVDLTPSLTNLLAQYAALSPLLQSQYNSVVGSDPLNFNNGNGLQNKVNLVGLLTLYQGITGPQQTDYQLAISANTAFYNNTPTGILNKMGLIKGRYYGLQQGQWMVDIGNGTVQLGSDPGGADVRVDAQAVGWGTLTLAGLITQIVTRKGTAVNSASMAQLDLDWAAGVGLYTGTADVNCLNILDEITAAEVCWWTFDATGAVEAGVFDIAAFRPDLLLLGSQPNVPLDRNFLPSAAFAALDPIPKMINSLAQVGVIPPAYRIRVGYAGRASPETAFLAGATAQEQTDLSAPELIADWSPALAASGLYELSPSEGVAMRAINPRAQDVYISSIGNSYTDALGIRTRLVQRVIGGIDHHLWTVTVRMDATKVKLMSSIIVLWIDENNRNRTIYSGSFRVTSAIMALGSGPQQLELWGIGSIDSNLRPSSFGVPPVAPISVPIAISFTSFTVLFDAIVGNVVANISVIMSSGSAFNGVLSVIDDTGTVSVNGNPNIGFTLVLLRNLTSGDIGSHTVTAVASAGGTTISQDYTFTVLGVSPPPTPPPVGTPTLSLTFTPSSPSLHTPVSNGDVVSILGAVWSDGTPFVGVFSFAAPNFDHGGDYAISGTNLIVNNASNLNALNVVTTEHVTIQAIPT